MTAGLANSAYRKLYGLHMISIEFAYRVILHADPFQNQLFSKDSFSNTIRVSTCLNQDQAQCFVWPDLGPNCLQSLSADDTIRQRVR